MHSCGTSAALSMYSAVAASTFAGARRSSHSAARATQARAVRYGVRQHEQSSISPMARGGA